MPRSKRFVISLLSSYASIGVNVLYTFASVPLALHYLDKEAFGLWALVTQLSGYLMLLEFGMNGSVARSLSDHKDHVEDGIYGSILRTGARVFAVQGALVVLLGLAIGWATASLLGLPPRLHQSFFILMAAQALLSGIKLASGSLASPLWCHQRLDLSNLASSLSLTATLVVLWLGFHLGWNLYSLPISTAAGFLVGIIVTVYSCCTLKLYPPREHRGHFDARIFRELLHFGGGLFLMNLGAQLASASQVIVVSRLLGIESAAVWAIATKIFNLAQQFVARIIDASAGGLAEMVVRGETPLLQKRFRDLVAISAVMAVAASAGLALTNGAFIEVWTSGRVTWEPWNNFLLGCVLFSTAITRCHTGLVGISKQIRGMKYIYLFEGLVFVTLSILLGRWIGFTGLLGAALVSNIAITGSYGIVRTASYFCIPAYQVIGWVARPAGIVLVAATLFALTRLPALADLSALPRLCIGIAAFGTIVTPSIWYFGMSPVLRSEFTGLLGKIFGKAKSKLRMA
ncbi:MAG: oligosaccharide flippase family protein [Verrucomicrobiota bacterium]